jgi:hypothetical protein
MLSHKNLRPKPDERFITESLLKVDFCAVLGQGCRKQGGIFNLNPPKISNLKAENQLKMLKAENPFLQATWKRIDILILNKTNNSLDNSTACRNRS